MEKIISLTNDQKEIYNKLMDFIKSDKEREILLIGYAGTGKTTMVTKFINDLINNNICKKIVMAAPTHKAVNIAKSKLFDNSQNDSKLLRNINIMTIHRLLNYQSYIDSEGNKYFAKGNIDTNWTIYNLIVVDECSMLSNQIISDIRLNLNNPLNIKIKILYVGDPAQLPPVNQSDSKIFNCGIKSLCMDKIIRTNNQNIMELSNEHRKWIFSNNMNDLPCVADYLCEKISLFSTRNKELKSWLDNFINIIKTRDNNGFQQENNEFNDNHNDNIILTWTNKKCNQYNQYVREKIFNKKDLDHYEIGEILIFGDFHRIKRIVLSEEDKEIEEFISFYTSEQVKLNDIEIIKYRFEKIKYKRNNEITDELNIEFEKRINKINKLIDIEIDVYKFKINKLSDIVENNIVEEYTVLTIHPDSLKSWNKICEEYEHIILKLKKTCYKMIRKLKNNNMTKCDLHSEVEKKINKLYKDWQDKAIDCFAQLNYGYAITVHKSQGSTFQNVFIDISDILDNNNVSETSKCLYTAITRSSNTLKLLV